MLTQLARFREPAGTRLRLVVVYSSNENTMSPTQAFAERARLALTADGGTSFLHRIDATTMTIEDLRGPVAFLHSELEHDEIARVDLWKVLAAAAP